MWKALGSIPTIKKKWRKKKIHAFCWLVIHPTWDQECNQVRRKAHTREERRMWTLRNHLIPNSWHLFLNVVIKEDSEHSAVSGLKIHTSSLLLALFTLHLL
jgi:hypothetical protein